MIRIPFISQPREYAVRPLEQEDSGRLSELHEEDFVRPWSEEEFSSLLLQEPVLGFGAVEVGRRGAPMIGFVLARLAAGEAEILTVAVARSYRRSGIGRQLMDAVLRELHAARAEALFLEVDETNAPAIALYRRLGFRQVGNRPDYYRDAHNRPTGALVMRRDLR